MRDTTKIKAIAQESIDDLAKLTPAHSFEQVGEVIAGVVESQKEIVRIATKMDARTGTIDPSAKKG